MALAVSSFVYRQLPWNGIRTHFQPVVDLRDGRILGYEALSRGPRGHDLARPDALFGAAEAAGCLVEMELYCQELAIQRFRQRGFAGRLFLNRHPQVLMAPDYPQGRTDAQIQAVGISPDDIVIELTEQHRTDDMALLVHALDYYRNRGYATALDDVGAGYNGLLAWTEVQPEFIKLDRHLLTGIAGHTVRQVLLQHLVSLCHCLGAELIVEGVETAADLAVLRQFNVPYAQGFFLAYPGSFPVGQGVNLPPLHGGPGRTRPA